MACTNLRPTLRWASVYFLGIVAAFAFAVRPAFAAPPTPALSTEDFLNHLGVNTHLDGREPSRRYLGLCRDGAGGVGDGVESLRQM